MTDFLKAATWYAEHGIPVFPRHGIVNGQCTCGESDCKHPGKHPATKHGHIDATIDIEILERWWKRNPNYNVAMATGAPSGVTVIDIDPRNDGDQSLEALIGKYGPLPTTAEAITGGGGRHIVIKYVPGCKKELAPGIDIKSDGGLIVIAPSIHKSGRRYEWDGLEGAKALLHPAPAAPWLVGLLTAPPNGNGQGPQPIDEKIPQGKRHPTLVSLAGTLRKRGLGEDEIFTTLWAVNLSRCVEPLSEVKVRKIAESICKYPAGTIGAGHGFHDADDPGPDEPGAEHRKKAEPVRVLNLDEVLALDRPKASMMIDGILPSAGCSLIIGPSKCGKTLTCAQMAIAIMSGQSLYQNYQVLKPGAVMIVQQDDPAGGAGVKQVFELSPVPVKGLPFYLVEKADHQLGAKFTLWLEEQITTLSLRLVILDSFTALRGGRVKGCDIVKQESAELSQLDELGKRAGCLILVIHHNSKGSANLDWSERGGGSYAMGQSTESQLFLTRYPELEISAPERLLRIQGRHSQTLEMTIRFREATLDFEHVIDGAAAPLYPLLLRIRSAFGNDEFTAKEFYQELGISRQHGTRQLERLYQTNVLQKTNRGVYRLRASL